MGVSDSRRGTGLRIPRRDAPLRGVLRRGQAATRELHRRLCRQLRPGCCLRVNEERTLGTGRGRLSGRGLTSMHAGSSWIKAGIEILEKIERTQSDAVERASQVCAEAIAAGGLVHLFRTGHSRIPVEEMFPRYGSYPGFHPIVELSMTFHTQVVGANGQRQAMFIERMPGLAEVILANFQFAPKDALIVFSAGGLGAVVVEMARGAKRRGLRVIAVTSVAQSEAGEVEPEVGARLLDEADIVIDLCTPAADALWRLEGLAETPVGPGSTLAAGAVAGAIKVRTAELLLAGGKLPPVITSVAEVGRKRSDELFEAAYREHARRAAHSLAT